MNNEAKLFVIGASGYIGHSIINTWSGDGCVIATSTKGGAGVIPLSLERPKEFDYGSIRPADVLLLPAAISAPDICAREYQRAWAVNVTGTSEFISRAIDRGGRIVFFSSDTVYGERDIGFGEDELCNPAGEYAVMKNEVEKKFFGNPLFKSIRLSYVFSREDKFTKYLLEFAGRCDEVELFHPFCRAIIHRADVVDGVLALARRWEEFPHAIINFGGPEVLSRIDFAECLKHTCLPNLQYRVTTPGGEFFKNRPRVIAMSSNILPNLLERPCRTLSQAAQIEFSANCN